MIFTLLNLQYENYDIKIDSKQCDCGTSFRKEVETLRRIMTSMTEEAVKQQKELLDF